MTTTCRTIPLQSDFRLYSPYTGSPVIIGDINLSNFNVNLGGVDGSYLDLELLNDVCDRTSPTLPDVGTPVIFKLITTGATFGGIVNSVSYTEDSGKFYIKMKVIDPKRIIENVSVLFHNFYCPVTVNGEPLKNFINIMNIIEGNSAVCPQPMESQLPAVRDCSVFGTSGTNIRGLKLKEALVKLQSVNPTVYSTSGAPLSIDLSNVINIVPPYVKLETKSGSLSDLIQSACDYAACDYYATLVETTIVIEIIRRDIPPTLGVINNLIINAQQTGSLLRGENGFEEIYNTSNRVVIGGQVEYINNYKNYSMVMGFNSKGEPNRVRGNNWKVELDLTDLKKSLALLNVIIPSKINISHEEILLLGSKEDWELYGCFRPLSASAIIQKAIFKSKNAVAAGADHLKLYEDLFKIIMNAPKKQGNIWVDANGIQVSIEDYFENLFQLCKIDEDLVFNNRENKFNMTAFEEAFKYLQNIVNVFYGKIWLVDIGSICVNPNPGNLNRIQTGGYFYVSDETMDSGFPGSRLQNGQFRSWSYSELENAGFITDDNKIKLFLEVENDKFDIRINGEDKSFKFNPEFLNTSDWLPGLTDGVLAKNSNEIFKNPKTGHAEVLVESPFIEAAPTEINKLADGIDFLQLLLPKNNDIIPFINNQVGIDITTTNIFKLGKLAQIDRLSFNLPMRSNMYSYGPWTRVTNPNGSTDILQKDDLVPWNYTDYKYFNTVGQSYADEGLSPSTKQESGSVTLAGLPEFMAGNFLNNVGVVITSVVVTFGESGVTTTYEFKTFSPKTMTGFARRLESKYRQDLQDRSLLRGELINRLRNFELQNKEIQKKIDKINREDPKPELPRQRASPVRVLSAQYFDPGLEQESDAGGNTETSTVTPQDPLSCNEICNEPSTSPPESTGSSKDTKRNNYNIGLSKTSYYDDSPPENFQSIAIMSIDGVFAPVSLNGRGENVKGSGIFRLPKYCKSTTELGENNLTSASVSGKLTKSKPSMPPINDYAKLPINQKYLNPILSKALLDAWDDRKDGSIKGIKLILLNFADKPSELNNTVDNIEKEMDKKTDFGFISLRGPLVMQGWGYDTEGKPIPNVIDNPKDAEAGKFNNNGPKNKFMKNWLKSPKSWPVGPIDLRFDRDRGVWVAPTQDRVVVAQLTSDLKPLGKATAVLINPTSGGSTFYDNYKIWGNNGQNLGQNIKNCKITVYDFLNIKISKGTKIYAMYNDNKYIVIESSVVSDEETPKIGGDNCDECGSSTQTTTTESETSSETCSADPCGLSSCAKQVPGYSAGVAGVLGVDSNGCITMYQIENCDSTGTPADQECDCTLDGGGF